MTKRRVFTVEFKRDTAMLVLDQGYSIKQARESMGVGESALRRWVAQLSQERGGQTPKGSKALTEDQQRIQALEKKVQKLEREKEILKKASALLMLDTYRA